MDVGTLTAVAGLPLAALAAYLAWEPQRTVRRQRAADRFVEVRRHLKEHRAELAEAGLAAHPTRDRDLTLLTAPGWIPAEPLPAARVRLGLRPEPEPGKGEFEVARRRLRGYWPRGDGFASAVGEYDRPAMWFNGPGYRLTGVTPEQGTLALEFALAGYFDSYDTAEPLAYEAALRHRDGDDPMTGRYRRWLRDPFDLGRRCAQSGVSTLTVRVDGDRAYFFLHRRDAQGVATAMNTTHVVPAGEFQPHVDVLPVWHSDLDLWHNTMREYAEEFLGAPDAGGVGGATLDYDTDEPYASMNRAAREGRARFSFLGLGLDPLNWKPELLTVCVWEAATFDTVFGGMAERNEEGVIVVGHGHQGLPFTEENVLGYARHPRTHSAGRACLHLAWRRRAALGIP
ncbi:hypothetical protein ACFW3D_10715 [Streptomyces sp. NPDC058864]